MERQTNCCSVQRQYYEEEAGAISENLERLEWFGLIIRDEESSQWHYAESTQAA